MTSFEQSLNLIKVSYYSVPEATRLGPGVALFDFLADCIADFMEKQKALIDPQKTLPLGFTFSFPMTQTSLDSGLLVTWTKSFNCSGVVGTDAVEHLNAAMRRLLNVQTCMHVAFFVYMTSQHNFVVDPTKAGRKLSPRHGLSSTTVLP